MGPKIAADTPKEKNPPLVKEVALLMIPSNPQIETAFRRSFCGLIIARADERGQTFQFGNRRVFFRT